MVSGLKKFLDFIKIEHTVFDLPFAYAGVLLSSIITLKIIVLVRISGLHQVFQRVYVKSSN